MQKCRANSTHILAINQATGVARRIADERATREASWASVSSHLR